MMSMWFQLVLTAFLVALPSLWIVFSSRHVNKLHKLIAVTAFLTFDLIVFGAFTRLTDSGLGCPDWPGCYGEANPFLAHADIKAAELALPTGPVTWAKAWIEMIHRYLAMGVGLLMIVQVVLAWLYRQRHQVKNAHWFASALLILVCVQGAFGKWTVTMKLQPIIVTIHLLLALSLLVLLVISHEREKWAANVSRNESHNESCKESHYDAPHNKTYSLAKLKWLAGVAFCALMIQIALGGWVSTNYAALACQDYPTCHGQWVPELDFEHAYVLWRELGKTANGDFLPVSALVTIHWVHRTFAWVAVTLLSVLVWRLWKYGALRTWAVAIAIVMLLQVTSGIATVFFSWPLSLAILHNAGATILVILMSVVNYRIHAYSRNGHHLLS